MRLHIIRHGQTDWNADQRIQGQLESELNETGIKQARSRSTDFKNIHLSAIYSSSSIRTRQTTKLILGERQEMVTYRDDLREVRLGVWQGLMWADVEAAYPKLVNAYRTASPAFEVEGAEKAHEVQSRGVKAIESIISAHSNADQDAHILIVSHGNIMKTILAHYAHVSLSNLHELPPLPNCAHCIINTENSKPTVESIAGTAFDESPWGHIKKMSSVTISDIHANPPSKTHPVIDY